MNYNEVMGKLHTEWGRLDENNPEVVIRKSGDGLELIVEEIEMRDGEIVIWVTV